MSHGETRIIPLAQLSLPAGSGWARMRWIGLGIGAIGILASFALRNGDPEQFYHSWLVSFLYFVSIGLGGLFFVLIHFAAKAGWGVVVRRLAENVAAALPLMGLMFVPVVLGMHDLFHWTHEEAVAADHLLQGKAAYLNSSFFIARAAGYFLLWGGIVLFYVRGSARQDQTGDEAITRRLTFFAGPSIIVFAMTLTFAAIDWIMTLDPHWYSTMFGVYYFAGSLVGAFALLILLAAGLTKAGYLRGVITVEHFHDLGKLLFAFSVFWAYIAFSQYFLIWYANMPEETSFFLKRAQGSWAQMTMFLAVGHFAVPFLFLMPRTIKRKTSLLVVGACWMLFIHLVDIHWLVMPNLHKYDAQPHILDLTTLLGIGGFFLGVIGWVMQGKALVPIRDPRLSESLSFENM